ARHGRRGGAGRPPRRRALPRAAGRDVLRDRVGRRWARGRSRVTGHKPPAARGGEFTSPREALDDGERGARTPLKKVGVLVSGRGSNLQALIAAAREGRLGGEVAVVVSNVASAPALDRARAAGVPALVCDH